MGKIKICTQCKIEKEVAEFYKEKRAKDGLTSACKKCLLTQQKKYYKLNPEAWKKRAHEWRKANPERNKKIKKKWYIENREHIYQKNKKWWLENAEQDKERQKNAANMNRKKIAEIHGIECIHCGATESKS